MKSVHLDRKLSATARLPKRSTIVESPAGRSVHPSDGLQPQRPHEVGTSVPHQSNSPIPQSQHGQQGQMSYQGQGNQSSRQSPPAQPPRTYYPNGPEPSDQAIRPSLSRGNTEVRIVDESAPNSPAGEEQHRHQGNRLDDGITLADIPQLMEVAQAREQQRSLPRESSIPYIAELSALELAIVKHSAVLALTRSPLKDQFDLEELLEMVEVKKSGFWNKLFKGDKKSVKKKGASLSNFRSREC
jgi:hypothetical protein